MADDELTASIEGASVEYVNVFAGEVGAVAAFLTQHLGFVVNRAGDDYTSLRSGSVSIGVAAVDMDDAAQAALVGRHTGIGVMVDDLDQAYRCLIDSGVDFTVGPTRYPWGGYMALVNDPAGNIYYLDQRGTH